MELRRPNSMQTGLWYHLFYRLSGLVSKLGARWNTGWCLINSFPPNELFLSSGWKIDILFISSSQNLTGNSLNRYAQTDISTMTCAKTILNNSLRWKIEWIWVTKLLAQMHQFDYEQVG